MILKFKIQSINGISSWAYREADEIYVHKKLANYVEGEYSFYATPQVLFISDEKSEEQPNYPMVFQIVLVNSEKINNREKAHRYLVIPVLGSEIYLLSNEGKTIERIN